MCDCPNEKRLREALEAEVKRKDTVMRGVVALLSHSNHEEDVRCAVGMLRIALKEQAPHKDSCEATITGDSDECDCREQAKAGDDRRCPGCGEVVPVSTAPHQINAGGWCEGPAKAGGKGGTVSGTPGLSSVPPPNPAGADGERCPSAHDSWGSDGKCPGPPRGSGALIECDCECRGCRPAPA